MRFRVSVVRIFVWMIESMAVFESQLGSIKVVSCEGCCRFHRLAFIFCGGIRYFFYVILPRHDSCSSEVEITENRDYWIPEWWGHLCWEYFVHCSGYPQKLEKKNVKSIEEWTFILLGCRKKNIAWIWDHQFSFFLFLYLLSF